MFNCFSPWYSNSVMSPSVAQTDWRYRITPCFLHYNQSFLMLKLVEYPTQLSRTAIASIVQVFLSDHPISTIRCCSTQSITLDQVSISWKSVEWSCQGVLTFGSCKQFSSHSSYFSSLMTTGCGDNVNSLLLEEQEDYIQFNEEFPNFKSVFF